MRLSGGDGVTAALAESAIIEAREVLSSLWPASSAPEVVDAHPEADNAERNEGPRSGVGAPPDADHPRGDRSLRRARLNERHDAAHRSSVARGRRG